MNSKKRKREMGVGAMYALKKRLQVQISFPVTPFMSNDDLYVHYQRGVMSWETYVECAARNASLPFDPAKIPTNRRANPTRMLRGLRGLHLPAMMTTTAKAKKTKIKEVHSSVSTSTGRMLDGLCSHNTHVWFWDRPRLSRGTQQYGFDTNQRRVDLFHRRRIFLLIRRRGLEDFGQIF